ncbi:MAG: hypothetical protein A2Z86_09335 [Candidatus Glassbacteria bacterium GWA2_58_10]|uniref:DUF1848 domain-containing protein n=1 Tax=Candidatus Glassbacteria bacterium GWA2_58_10 TaxID=1817865 RepID=A0A1F5YD90_9BACT|nr:MAG: hypothetical protein A2Z86_09335 [Candidatus Glassbacteria bacterium GWA2_58_10]
MATVISASRRTDIPAFYLDWFINCLRKGRFRLTNPFNDAVHTVRVSGKSSTALVFWSKNFGPLIRRLKELSGWSAVFNFTLNSPDPLLEPGVPPLEDRLEQMKTLALVYGPRAVRWRFDPVVFYRTAGKTRNNLGSFERLLSFAAELGLKTCTVSFMDPYRKIAAREKLLPDFSFSYPGLLEMQEIASRMARTAGNCGIRLLTCCEAGLAGAGIANLEAGSCIDHGLLNELYALDLDLRQDPGQRKAAGCLCHESVDVGSYRDQPCRCGCLYCYANPIVERRT